MKEKRSKAVIVSVLCVLFLITFLSLTVYGEVPHQINYQGYLTDSDGDPVPDDDYQMSFAIYNGPTGGIPLWSETQTVTMNNGIYNVELGALVSIDLSFDEPYYLGIKVDTDNEMTPRNPLTSVGYAMKAAVADSVANGAITTVHLANDAVTGDKIDDGAVTGAKIADGTVTASDINDGSGSELDADRLDGHEASDFITAVNAGNGLVGGGSSGPVTLDVEVPLNLFGSVSEAAVISGTNSDWDGYGIYGKSIGSKGVGVYGEASNTMSTMGYSYGGYFTSAGTDGRGVYGEASNEEGSINYGGYFSARGTLGKGVYGQGNSTGVDGYSWGPVGYGVYGYATGPSGKGVYGVATGSWSTGVYGEASESSDYAVYGIKFGSGNYGYLGSNNDGVHDESSSSGGSGVAGINSGSGSGVYGRSTGGHAGYFDGNTKVTANLLVDGRSGIGTESPEYQLDVRGDRIQLKETAGKDWIAMRTDGNDLDITFHGGTLAIQSDTDGEHIVLNPTQNSSVGVGTWGPTQKLDVNGNARFRSVGSSSYNRPLNLTSDGTLTTATSDGRLKTSIENIEDGLEIVEKLQGVRFNWKDDTEGKRRVGLIAQDVEKVIPELTYTNPVDGYMGINYAELNAVLIEAVKDQQQTIDKLGVRLSELEKRETAEIESLKVQVNRLQTMIEIAMTQQSDLKGNKMQLTMNMRE